MGQLGLDEGGGLGTGAVGQAVVHHHDVGAEVDRRPYRGPDGVDDADDLEIVLLAEGPPEALGHEIVVLDDEHASLRAVVQHLGHLSLLSL